MKMMFMGRVSLCEREMSKRMENKEKSEKRIRKTEKVWWYHFYRNCIDGTWSYGNCVADTWSYENCIAGTRSYVNCVAGTWSYRKRVASTRSTTGI